jgi:hypothetical protein
MLEFRSAATAALPILVAAVFLVLVAPVAAPGKEIVPIAEAQRGTMVTVRGTVDRITDEDEFRLTDRSGSIWVYVGPNWVPAEVGETVTVAGFVDEDFGPREIYARTLTRADGSVVTFEHDYE